MKTRTSLTQRAPGAAGRVSKTLAAANRATSRSRALSASASRVARKSGAALAAARRRRAAPGQREASLPLPVVHSAAVLPRVADAEEDYQRAYIRAGQLARLNLARELSSAVAQATAGQRGEELMALADKFRATGKAHEVVSVRLPMPRAAFLRLFGSRVRETCCPFGRYSKAGAQEALLLLHQAQDDAGEIAGILEPSKDRVADWDTMSPRVAECMQGQVTQAAFSEPLTAPLTLGRASDMALLCDAQLPRPASLSWTVGAFLSPAGVTPVLAVPHPGKARVTWTPDADAAKAGAREFAGAVAQGAGLGSGKVATAFFDGPGVLELRLPLRFTPGASPVAASQE